MKPKIVLTCQKIVKKYQIGPQTLTVLDELEFDARESEQIGIIGASGSGKTTLLNILGGLDTPTTGMVCVAGKDFSAISDIERGKIRNKHLGFVYQFHHLLPEFTAIENVAMPLLIGNRPVNEAHDKALAILERVGLAERGAHKPAELSGGERQRVAIARALVTQPDLVLMDEPTGNLDQAAAANVHQLMDTLNKELGICFIVVTHDLKLASRMQRVMRLSDGKLKEVDVSTVAS